jgi:hypothetical protein
MPTTPVNSTEGDFAMKTLAAASAAMLMLLGTTAGTARADHLRHPDHLAHTLKRQAREIYIEVATHFRSSSHYRRMVRTAYDLYELADHIEDVAVDGRNAAHLASDLHEMHDLLETLEDQNLQVNGPRLSLGGNRGMGPGVGAEHVQHLSLLIAAADDTLHQLEELMVRGGNCPTEQHIVPGRGPSFPGVGPNFGTQPAPPVGKRTVPGGVRIPLQFGKQGGGVTFNLVLR